MRPLVSTPRTVAMVAVVAATVGGLAATAGAASLPVPTTGGPATTSTGPAAPVTSGASGLPGTGTLSPAIGSVLGPLLGAPTAPAVASAPAAASPAPATAHVTASGSPTLTVTPSTNLTNGETVTVTASGMHANAYGSVLECNLANNEPTIQVEGNAVPVGCTNPLQTITGTDASGGFSKQFVIHTGTIGPPAQGTDSAGNSASADAAKYPCPPTPAQQASGTTCDIVYGDTSGDQATAPLSFASSASPSSPGALAASGGSAGTATGADVAGTSASGTGGGASGASGSTGALAFTGAGAGLQWLTGTGLSLVLGGILLSTSAMRRRRLRTAP